MIEWYSGFMNEGVPYSDNYINLQERHKQKPAHLRSNAFYMYRRYLLQKAMSVFKWEFPKSWDENYFLFGLYGIGNVAQIQHKEYGNIVQNLVGYRGHDIYYRPTIVTISNAVFPVPIERNIVKEWDENASAEESAVIWHLTPDYCGIMDLINYYAGLMANLSGAVDSNAYNCHVAYIFTAKNKSIAETFKKVYDQISEGNPAVFADSKLFDDDGKPLYEMIGEDINSFYIIDKLLLDLSKLDDMFSQEIGIPNANTEKKERMITDEVNANNFETKSKCELWLDNLHKCEKLSEKVFGAENTPRVSWREELEIEGGDDNENAVVNDRVI